MSWRDEGANIAMVGDALFMAALAPRLDLMESPWHIAGRCIQEVIRQGDSIGSSQGAYASITKVSPTMAMLAPSSH